MSIVRGVCIGKSACSVPVHATQSIQWTPSTSLGTDCEPGKRFGDVCRDTFSAGGSLSTCTTSEPRRLIAVATCYSAFVHARHLRVSLFTPHRATRPVRECRGRALLQA